MKNNFNIKSIFFITFITVSVFMHGQNSPQIPIGNSNWVATDALGRVVPDYSSTGATKPNKYVGVFYYIWHGSHGNTLYDNTKLLAANPNSPAWGGVSAFHWWGESEAGYYKAQDKWVIRRNLQMLTDAGVDFIYLDLTNAFTYLPAIDTLCKVSLQMRAEGIATPYFVCTLHSSAGTVANNLYDAIYAQDKYKSLWFYWAGKPLLLTDLSFTDIRPEVKNFFNMKNCWAWTDPNKPNQWQWIDTYPQDWGWTVSNRDHEQLAVAAASHPTTNRGDSYTTGVQPIPNQFGLTPFTGQGRHFTEQWSRVFALNPTPTIVMVTQWNEWMAQRFVVAAGKTQTFLNQTLIPGETYFVDSYNQEYNRDIEPMKDGHSDNKYYQMVSNIRKFKGMQAPETASASQTVAIDGVFTEWQNVKPKFTDPTGDTYHRNEAGYASATTYVNRTGRNDIIESRAAVNADNVYLYAKTNSNLTNYTDNNWMLCFIDADQNIATGWQGFDYVLNVGTKSATQLPISKWENNAWTQVATVNYKYAGTELEVAIPRSTLSLTGASVNFNFQWADNIQRLNDINEFFINGDVAPDRRFRYTYANSLTPTGISTVAQAAKFDIFPNPSSNVMTIKASTALNVVTIYNLIGEVVYTSSKAGNELTIATEQLGGKGIYFVKVNSGVKKLIVIK